MVSASDFDNASGFEPPYCQCDQKVAGSSPAAVIVLRRRNDRVEDDEEEEATEKIRL